MLEAPRLVSAPFDDDDDDDDNSAKTTQKVFMRQETMTSMHL